MRDEACVFEVFKTRRLRLEGSIRHHSSVSRMCFTMGKQLQYTSGQKLAAEGTIKKGRLASHEKSDEYLDIEGGGKYAKTFTAHSMSDCRMGIPHSLDHKLVE